MVGHCHHVHLKLLLYFSDKHYITIASDKAAHRTHKRTSCDVSLQLINCTIRLMLNYVLESHVDSDDRGEIFMKQFANKYR